MTESSKLYPNLNPEGNSQYRLTEMIKSRDRLQLELDEYAAQEKNMKKYSNKLGHVSQTLTVMGTICSGSAVAAVAGGVTLPVSIPLAAVAGVAGICGTIMGRMQTKYSKKASDVTVNKVLAISALNQMNETVNKSISDQVISSDEYSKALSINSEYKKLRDSQRIKNDTHKLVYQKY
jgi:hypothetical protein